MREVNKTAREYFLPIANACRPAPTEAMLRGVICCCFDNLQMKVNYGAYSTDGETGHLLDMTNWFSTRLPVHLAPNFDAEAICALRRRRRRPAPPLTIFAPTALPL